MISLNLKAAETVIFMVQREDFVPDEDITYFPLKYTENYLYLLEVDPNHLHLFWEIIPESLQSQNNLVLKLKYTYKNHSNARKEKLIELGVCEPSNDFFLEIRDKLYECKAEIGYYENGIFSSICHSNSLELEKYEENDSELEGGQEIWPEGLNHNKKIIENEPMNKRSKRGLKELNSKDNKKQTEDKNQESSIGNKNLLSKGSPEKPEITALSEKQNTEQESNRIYLRKTLTKNKIIDYYKNLPKQSSDYVHDDAQFTPWRQIINNLNSLPPTDEATFYNFYDNYEIPWCEEEHYCSSPGLPFEWDKT